MEPSFWEKPESVEKFAGRDADHRLVRWVAGVSHPAEVKVLDLGCAGGRNADLLARRGFDLWALDSSSAMVERTRERVAGILGPDVSADRVLQGSMDDLSLFPDDRFDLIVALGIYHNATSLEEWSRTLDESVRVLAPGGRILVALFSPSSAPRGEPLVRRPGSASLYDGFGHGPMTLVEAEQLDREMASRGLVPEVPTESVRVVTAEGHRVTVNAFYRRATA